MRRRVWPGGRSRSATDGSIARGSHRAMPGPPFRERRTPASAAGWQRWRGNQHDDGAEPEEGEPLWIGDALAVAFMRSARP